MSEKFGKDCLACKGKGCDACNFLGVDGDATYWPPAVADHQKEMEEALEGIDTYRG